MKFNDWWEKYVTASGGGDCQMSDIANAILNSDLWMNDAIEEFITRAEALSDILDKGGGKKALFAELEKTPKGMNQVLHLLWAQQNLLAVIKGEPETWPLMPAAGEEPEKEPSASRNNVIPTLADLLTDGCEALHITWLAVGKRTGLKHPVAALIDAWLSRPVPANQNTKPTGIIVKEHYLIHELGTPAGDDLAEVSVGQAMLPGLKDLLPDYDEMDTFPVLAMFDALRGSDKEAGLGLRMLVTILTEIDTQISTPISDSGVLVHMTLHDLVKHLCPKGWRRNKCMPRLRAAMLGWDHAGVPDRGGLRRVIGTVGEWIALPDDYPLDGSLLFQVYLPPGAQQGALVHRETLDHLGANSGLMYRAALTLAHQWWRAARTKGKNKRGEALGTTWPYAKRPAKARDDDDRLLDIKGEAILNSRGYPITNWNDPRTVSDPNRANETNPMIRYLPTYTDERLVKLCYAASKVTDDNRHVYLKRALKAVHGMEQLGLLEMAVHDDGLKLCPPPGWGVNFQMPAAVMELGTRATRKI